MTVSPGHYQYLSDLDLHFLTLPADTSPDLFDDRGYLVNLWQTFRRETAGGGLPHRKAFTLAKLGRDLSKTGFARYDADKKDYVFTLYPNEMVERGSQTEWTGRGFGEMMMAPYGGYFCDFFDKAIANSEIAVTTGYNPVAERTHVRFFSIGCPILHDDGGHGLALTFCPLTATEEWASLQQIDLPKSGTS